LKARQKGISKAIDADQLLDCVKKSTSAVVISHEQVATERLFAAVRYYVENMAAKPLVSIDSKREMKFPKRGSTYFIGTAGQRAFGRGDTVDRAHLSEAAFYLDLEKILGGIAEAAEYGQIDIETTPNGREQFYDMWQKAKTGRSPYTAIFIPWFIDTEYSVDSLTREERDGLSAGVREMFSIPDAEFLATIGDEEKRLVARVAQEYGIIMTAGQLKWRRYKIWDKGMIFYQEYPEDDVSCFLQSGRSVFTQITTDTTKRIPLDNFEKWADEETRAKFKKKILFGGVDCAEGVRGGDRHCFSVIDANVGEEKAQVIFEYTSDEPIDVFWDRIEPIMKSFRIWTGIEKNGVGVAHVKEARGRKIPFIFEWWTGDNRPLMFSDLETAYRKETLIEGYTEAENEARDMIYVHGQHGDRPDTQKNKHDDRVMSRAIALQMRKKPVPGITLL
jgi:hypothetical protein